MSDLRRVATDCNHRLFLKDWCDFADTLDEVAEYVAPAMRVWSWRKGRLSSRLLVDRTSFGAPGRFRVHLSWRWTHTVSVGVIRQPDAADLGKSDFQLTSLSE
jgi:hypothetical protein